MIYLTDWLFKIVAVPNYFLVAALFCAICVLIDVLGNEKGSEK